MRPLGDTVDGSSEILEHSQGSVLGLVACGKCSAGCSRVSHAIGGTLCVDKGREGKTGETERRDADATVKRTQIRLGGIDLVDAHTVAYKVKHILGLAFGHYRQSQQEEAQKCTNSPFHLQFCYFFTYKVTNYQ